MPFSPLAKTPSELYNLLLEVAKAMQSDLHIEKLKEIIDGLKGEFDIICLLNALFGDPTKHLCYLSKDAEYQSDPS